MWMGKKKKRKGLGGGVVAPAGTAGAASATNAKGTTGLSWRLVVVAALASMVIAFALYHKVLHAPFIFDDQGYITENRIVRDLGNFIDLSGTRYVAFLSFAVNYAISGTNTFGYHVTNVLVHAVNGVLVFSLAMLILATPAMRDSPFAAARAKGRTGVLFASSAALLFLCHPVQTQAVSYLTQRFASLATLFYLLAVVLYVAARVRSLGATMDGRTMDGRSKALYILAFLSTVAAMKTKEISFTLPAMLILFEFAFFTEKVGLRRRLALLAPFIATMAIIPLSLFWALFRPGGGVTKGAAVNETLRELQVADLLNLSPYDYLMTQFTVVVTYLRLLVFPVGQNLDYDFATRTSFFEPAVMMSFLLLAALFVASIQLLLWSKKEGRGAATVVAFGVLWFALAVSVESSVIPIQDVIFEHRVYLPSIGAALVFLAALFITAGYLTADAARRDYTATTVVLIIAVMLAGASYKRNLVWQSEIGLWEDVVEKSPGKSRGHSNLGTAYFKAGRIGDSLKELTDAVAIKDGYSPLAHYNLGRVYIELERYEEALAETLIVLEAKPDFARGLNNAALIYQRSGDMKRAIEYFNRAARSDPYNPEVRSNLGFIYQKLGEYDRAEPNYLKALELSPANSDFHANYGTLLVKLGRTEEAAREFTRAVELDPRNHRALNNLGSIYFKAGRIDDAVEMTRRAVEVKPDSADSRFNLAVTLTAKGMLKEAASELEKVLELDPTDGKARRKLHILREKIGE